MPSKERRFQKIHERVLEALTNDSDTKGMYFDQENSSQFFPVLLLKSSVIQIERGD